jgi:hypothetical protein
MKLTFEIVAIWTALNFIVGIPVWMLVKLRDRREMAAKGIDYEAAAYADESHTAHASSGNSKSDLPASGSPATQRPTRSVPLVVGARRLMPGAGSAMLGTVHRTSTDPRSITDV